MEAKKKKKRVKATSGGYQVCGGCKEEKPTSEFYKLESHNNELSRRCKICYDRQQGRLEEDDFFSSNGDDAIYC